jgi:small subunit ribosomal protein S21
MSRKPNVSIKVGKDEPIEKAIKRFKRLCEKIGIKKEVKSRRYYEKPSEARRREARKQQRNRRKNIRKTDEQNKYNKRNKTNWMFNHPKLTEE